MIDGFILAESEREPGGERERTKRKAREKQAGSEKETGGERERNGEKEQRVGSAALARTRIEHGACLLIVSYWLVGAQ